MDISLNMIQNRDAEGLCGIKRIRLLRPPAHTEKPVSGYSLLLFTAALVW